MRIETLQQPRSYSRGVDKDIHIDRPAKKTKCAVGLLTEAPVNTIRPSSTWRLGCCIISSNHLCARTKEYVGFNFRSRFPFPFLNQPSIGSPLQTLPPANVWQLAARFHDLLLRCSQDKPGLSCQLPLCLSAGGEGSQSRSKHRGAARPGAYKKA